MSTAAVAEVSLAFLLHSQNPRFANKRKAEATSCTKAFTDEFAALWAGKKTVNANVSFGFAVLQVLLCSILSFT